MNEVAIKERPILMSGPMVLALLEGRKTQTRRVVRVELGQGVHSPWLGDDGVWRWMTGVVCYAGNEGKCPYGKPGERLWVRETWTPLLTSGGVVRYAMFKDGSHKFETGQYDPGLPMHEYASGAFDGYKWRPSIHMPRWACRIVLEITDVRVEQLSRISDADAVAEGAIRLDFPGFDGPRWSMERTDDPARTMGTPRLAFGNYWNRLRGDRSGYWPEPSPWVWAISFRKLEGGSA